MPNSRLILLAFAAASAAACVPADKAPPTVEQKCALAVSAQTGTPADQVVLTGTVATAIGPKIYVTANGATYTCQGDNNGNIGAVDFQS
jgi:hypothetical protein